jgi:hypothetical protein
MKRQKGLGDVIAARELRFHAKDGGSVDLLIEIGRPVPDPEHQGMFVCPYRISGLGPQEVRFREGVDSFQALSSALASIPVEVEYFSGRVEGRLTWDGGEGHGFPEHRYRSGKPNDA